MTVRLRLLLLFVLSSPAWGAPGAAGVLASPPHDVAAGARGAPQRVEASAHPPRLPHDTIEGNLSIAASRELCRNAAPESEQVVDGARRHLEEGTCAAILWVDGLFGPRNNIASARATSGTIELSSRYSQARGFSPDVRLRLRYHLPNVQRRVNMFLDRDGADDDPVQDRRERFSTRSRLPTAGVDRWMAGLGLTPRGRFQDQIDARVGVRPSSTPAVFGQVRARQQFTRGRAAELRLRQTGFWESRDGFGVTAGSEYHHLFPPLHLFRLGGTGTLSEASEGVEWQGEGAFYRRLSGERTTGLEAFIRGATSAPVSLAEYGFHGLFQVPLGHPHLLGEIIAGVTWPREEAAIPRERSFLVGLRVELGF